MSVKRPSKYRAKPQVVDGIRFASQAEARRYGDLKLLEKAEAIRELEIQPTFPIEVMNQASGEVIQVGVYKADFRYREMGAHPSFRSRVVVEDVKGMRTVVYRLKKRLVEAIYGITIQEIQR
jgi:hypothetical protein